MLSTYDETKDAGPITATLGLILDGAGVVTVMAFVVFCLSHALVALAYIHDHPAF